MDSFDSALILAQEAVPPQDPGGLWAPVYSIFFLLMHLQSVSLGQQMLMRKEPPTCRKV